MAVITQIELANYLGEGYKVDNRRGGEDWNPLYRAVTLPLRGQSAAIQIENGDGKSSISESCIYLLSRDRRLREKVFTRCAPSDSGWSHVRIEFGIKDPSENLLQQDLITATPEEFPGSTYVVGMCANRDAKEANFYIYNGTFNDAPAYRQTENGLVLIDNETFKKSVEKIGGSKWNKWSRKADWEEDIRQFVDTEVVRQNVEFQVTGAGDASAMLHSIKPEAGESFDAAFFRQLIAPELLKNPMGNESDNDEHHFEDTLVKSLQGVSAAMVEIAAKEVEYQQAADALAKFEPVIERAERVIQADSEYSAELDSLVEEAAIIHSIIVSDPVPGFPQVRKNASWVNDKRIVDALSQLVIDKREGVLITDDGLAKLIGIDVGRVNQYAAEKKIHTFVCDSQLIDFEDVVKDSGQHALSDTTSARPSQPTDYKDDIKRSWRGGRRHAVKGYSLEAAKNLVVVTQNLHGAQTSGLADLLTKAFGIAISEIDTNPYRRERNRLYSALSKAKMDLETAKNQDEACQSRINDLEKQIQEAEANQIAYSDFVQRKSEFPEHLHDSPLEAREWANRTHSDAQTALSAHENKVGQLTAGFESWSALTNKHVNRLLESVLAELNSQHKRLTTEKNDAASSLLDARKQKDALSETHTSEDRKLQSLYAEMVRFGGLRAQLPVFQAIFGEVDPDKLNPQAELKEANARKAELVAQSTNASKLQEQFTSLQAGVALYGDIFGEADPSSVNPVEDLNKLQQEISTEESIINEHQPYVDALTVFSDQYPDKTPTQWLEDAARQRQQLNSELIENRAKTSNLRGELDDLEKFSVADDRVYSQALRLLEKHGIHFERLYDVISAVVESDRRKHLLSLFSSALSAPVIASIEDAEAATSALEKARTTVPVFLKSHLEEFARTGALETSGDLAFNFLVGRRTRQVDILLDPNLVAEEKARIEQDIQSLVARNTAIAIKLSGIAEDSEDVQSVLMARDAITKNSIDKYATANATWEKLQELLPELKARTVPEALSSIASMKRFVAIGGQARLTELVEQEIPAIAAAMGALENEIIRLEGLTTDEANKARVAAKEFKAAGGEEKYKADLEKLERQDALVKSLQDQLATVSGSIKKQEAIADSAATQATEFEKTYYLDAKALEQAIRFESDGHVTFMKSAEQMGTEAITAVSVATRRLSGIDFEKAARYLESVKQGDRDITERIANAKAAKAKSAEDIVAAGKDIQQLDVYISTITPMVEELHEMVIAARDQFAKIVMLSDDVREKFLLVNTSGHEINRFADEVRLACMGDKPGTSDDNKASIYNLKVSIDALKLDTQQLLRLNKARMAASRDFDERRNEFCAKARNNEISGLSHLEIDGIANANTIEELLRVKALTGQIQKQIDEKNADLQKSKDLAEQSKNASIENMSKFARQAEANLRIMDRVMQKTPSGRFYIDVQIADHDRVLRVVESLLNDIQDRERSFRERSAVMLNEDIAKRKEIYRDLVKRSIYKNLFINPVVEFSHTGIWGGARKPMNNEMSKGQITALHLMWMIKQAEYSLQLVASRYHSKRERETALKNSQRILFFDGLFSNLSNDNIIDDAFQGLKYVGENFQLIGLLHHPRYVNNSEIFPIHLVGKRFRSKGDQNHRGFMAIQPWQKGGEMAMFASFFKRNVEESHAQS